MRYIAEATNNLRYGFRQLRRSPGFTLVAVITLALGIGANTAIFSVLDGVVLAPLPFREPDRLVIVALYNRNLQSATYLSYPDFLDWQRDSRSFEQIAAFTREGFDLTSPGTPEHVSGMEVSSGFWSTLGVNLALGRELSPEEDRPGGMPAAVISDRLWRERFAGATGALGKTIALNGVDCAIVGILRPGFRFYNQQADVYTSIGQGDPLQRKDRTIHNILSIARLRPEVSITQAQAEMNTVQEHIDQLNPATERGQGTSVESLKRVFVGDVSGTLLLLLGAVGLVLLIACANVANLMLARSAVRTREFAVRLALGANRMQIVRQLLSESVLLALIGGTLGSVFAQWGLKGMLSAIPANLPRAENIRLNASVLLFTFAVSMTVGIVFGLLPALKSSNTGLHAGLKEGGRGSAGVHHRAQRGLVVVQIALALVLLSGGSLLLRTIHNLWEVNPGFEPRHVITFQVGLSPSVTQTPLSTRIAYRQLTERISQVPGVSAADLTALVPLSQLDNAGPFWIGPRQPASMAEVPRAVYYWTGPDYLRTMEIPLLRGRFLSAADTSLSDPVVVIDSLLARSYFPGQDAVGQTITVAHWGVARIVGVVEHVQHWTLDHSDPRLEKPQIYASFYQLLDAWVPVFRKDLTIAVRTSLDSSAVMPSIKNAVYGAGSGQPVYNVRTMQELVAGSMASQRLAMVLLSALAVLALVLAVVGIYGTISYLMTKRVHEIGIRMALGAERRDVLRLVLGQGARLAVSGIAIGVMATLVLAPLLPSFARLLYGVRPYDPLTLVVVGLVLAGATLLACYLPARRAAGLDPIVALRNE